MIAITSLGLLALIAIFGDFTKIDGWPQSVAVCALIVAIAIVGAFGSEYEDD